MKRLKQHWMMAPLSWLLSAALAFPAWLALTALFLAAPSAAQAQTLNRPPTWAVVDFENHSGYGGAEVGVQASDGFVVELSKTNKYVVIPRADTQAAITNNGLVQPLDRIGLQKLAEALNTQDNGCDAVATGEVAAVTFTNNPRRATVSLIIRVVDRISGELINGAIAQGTSTPRPIPTGVNDDDALVDQAISNADFEAVRQISAFSLPRATVLIHDTSNSVTLNKGTQDGLYNGLSMIVTRNGAEVGRIKVDQASSDESLATVTDQGLGIQPQDVATAIYQLPPYSMINGTFRVGPSAAATAAQSPGLGGSGASHSLFSGASGLLLAALVAGGLYALARSGSGSGGNGTTAFGGASIGGVRAVEDTTPVPLVLATDTNAETGDNARFVPLRIKITYDLGQFAGNSRYIETHIYRNPQPSILVPGTFAPPAYPVSSAEIGRIPIISPATSPAYDSAQDIVPIYVQKPLSTNPSNLDTANYFDGTATDELPILGTALNVGDQVSYSVEVLYSVPNFNTGSGPGGTVGIGNGTTNTIYALSSPSDSNPVTYLQPVILRSSNSPTYPIANPNTGTPLVDSYAFSHDPTNVNVTVPAVYGGTATALQYQLQISPDPLFGSNIVTLTTTANNSATSFNFRTGNTFTFGSINLTTQPAAISGANTLYVRVGVRDLRNGTDEGINPYLWSSSDPNVGNGGTLPTVLTPGSPANRAAAKQRSSAAALAPGVTESFIVKGHARGSASARSSARSANVIPSATPHAHLPINQIGPIVRTPISR